MSARSWGPADGPLGPLDQALRECEAERFSGALHVIGAPGGLICLVEGAVSAIETPWSPSPEVIFLRSGRVSPADWEAASTAATVARGRMSDELVTRGLVGAGELEAVLRTALADAMFAFAAGFVDTCRAEAGALDFEVPLEPGAQADWLVAEALRRMQVLADFSGPPLHARARVTAAPRAARLDNILDDGREGGLALIDGRRTIRDLAFARGRGLYVTMLEVARMRSDGLIAAPAPGGQHPGDEEADPGQKAAAVGPTASGLPRRHKDRPVQPKRTGDLDSRPFPAVLRLLRPRGDGGPQAPRTVLTSNEQGEMWLRTLC
jgi:hypothetical protein